MQAEIFLLVSDFFPELELGFLILTEYFLQFLVLLGVLAPTQY